MNPPSSVQFEIDHAIENPAWDELVARSPGVHHEQTTVWAARKRHHGWQAYRILVREHGRLIGGAQVLHRRALKLTSIGFISRGPIAESAESIALVTQQVIAGLKITAHGYLVLLPSYIWTDIVPVLIANGFHAKPDMLMPDHLVTATTVVDLRQDLETILARMNESTRSCIRRGIKRGIEIGQGTAADIDTMHQRMCQLCARREIVPEPASAKEFHDIWECLAPRGMVKLFVSRYQSETISAGLSFVYGENMLAAKTGWSGEHPELFPNHMKLWEMIKWAKASGLKQLDLHHLVPAHAKAVLRGEELVDDGYSGVTKFKLGFGGDIIVIPDSYYRSFNRAGQAALKLGGAKLLARGRIQRVVNRLSRNVPRWHWIG